MLSLKRAWQGEEKFWKIFWLLGGLGWIIPTTIAYTGGYLYAVEASIYHDATRFIAPAIGIVYFICFIVWSTMLWKCRANVGGGSAWKVVECVYYFCVLVVIFCLTRDVVQQYAVQIADDSHMGGP